MDIELEGTEQAAAAPEVATQTETTTTETPTAAPMAKPVRTPALPAFVSQQAVKVPTFKLFVESRGHKMEDFKLGEEGKALRKAMNLEYEIEKGKFNAACAGELSKALASGEFTITKASKNKSGAIMPVLTPVKKNSAEQRALALLQASGKYKIVKSN